MKSKKLRGLALAVGFAAAGWADRAVAEPTLGSGCHVWYDWDGNQTVVCDPNGETGGGNPGGSDPEPAPTSNIVYQTSFERGLNGWTTWANCATDGGGSVTEYYTGNDAPAPGGGSYAMRLHTTGLSSSCAFPGNYALSPSQSASAGTAYRVTAMTRNAANHGKTTLIFYDSNGWELSATEVNWSADAWTYSADAVLRATAPAGTTSLRVRFGLNSPNEYADIDLVSVRKQ